ncbi:MAG TPA: hypothetical protein VKB03_10740 [Conexibacter sp.]|nr:hypothetical protein [Conexibacter sp.]
MTSNSTIIATIISIAITSFLRAVAPRNGWSRREFGRCAIERVSLIGPVYRVESRIRPGAREILQRLREVVTIPRSAVASYPW